ncbi:helix-turn-helix transcriptional regulator [Nostoc sp.]|uniref:helix-turn-helix transcriptional regulator n=1 Tax=Nostoc sp. TaxID=1180 RepID=UPI002FF694A3
MTINISRHNLFDIFFEVEQTKQGYDPADEFDILWQYPSQFGEGYCRTIELQQGLGLLIAQHQLHEDLAIKASERGDDYLFYGCCLSGSYEGRDVHSSSNSAGGAGQYILSSGGALSSEIMVTSARQPFAIVDAWMSPERFCSFAGNASGEIPPELEHLLRQSTQQPHTRYETTSPAMLLVAQQILHCPYWGMTKRIYLESKALELLALMIAEEREAQQGKQLPSKLKLQHVDCIHHARNILLGNLDNPPSLMELARKVGLNERSLRQGFRRVFGTTAFAYLHDYRLEKARQLLSSGEMKVIEVAYSIGFVNRSYFAAAFKKKFGLSPKEYQMQQKKSG